MALIDEKMAVWVISAIAAYFFYRWLFGIGAKEPSLNRYESEIDEILTSDKYKVKGRFED